MVSRKWSQKAGFFSELEQCVIEYMGEQNLVHLRVEDDESLTQKIEGLLESIDFSFLILDTRCAIIDAAMPRLFIDLLEARHINFLCRKFDVIPIIINTDPLMPGYAILSDLLSYPNGLNVPITAAIPFSKFIRRNELYPTGIPISKLLLRKLEIQRNFNEKNFYIGGSFYPERKEFFERVIKNLEFTSLSIKRQEKQSNSYFAYLQELMKSRMVLNTNFVHYPYRSFSHKIKLQTLGKSFEALIVKSLLITHATPLLNHYLVEYEDYIPINSMGETIELINYFHANEEHRKQIAESGYLKIKSMINEQPFFERVNQGLIKFGIKSMK
jgi:hypothetical protein